MKVYESPYPPIPPLPDRNFHSWLFEQPPGNAIPKDYLLHVDGVTGKTRTYGEFYERVRDAATGLSLPVGREGRGKVGVVPGVEGKDIIGIFSENCMDYIVLVHAALVLGTPFALIPAHPTLQELVYLLKKATVTRLFVQASNLTLARKAAKEVGLAESRIYVLEGQKDRRDLVTLDEIVEDVRARKDVLRQPVVQVKKDNVAYLMFSSGTSGLPKAVMISHGNLNFSIAQLFAALQEVAKVIQATPEPQTWLAFLPFYHSFALHYCVFRTFLSPTTLVILPKWNLRQAIASIPKYRITHVAAVPSIIHQLVHSAEFRNTDLTSLRMIGSGAAYLPPALMQELQTIVKTQVATPEGYGLTEATISAITKPTPGILGGMQPVPNSTGIIMAGQSARIVREDGSDAEIDEPGELWLTGPNIALGYWNDPESTKKTFKNGWIATGDRFRVDKNHVFYFEDRLKDTLKISGAQVSPAEIEDTLLAEPHKYIKDAAVCGVDGGGRTSDEKVPRAWVVLTPAGKKVGEKEVVTALDAWVKENLSRFKWLRGGIEVTEEIPKNPTGKVLRRVLQENYNKRVSQKAKL